MGCRYSDKEYWDTRYGNEFSIFEWYENYDSLSGLLQEHVPVDAAVLQVRHWIRCVRLISLCTR
jgi:hypothetical protein